MDVSGAISKMATHKKMMSLPWLNSIKWALDELHSARGMDYDPRLEAPRLRSLSSGLTAQIEEIAI
jgi:hypothetical protein